MTPSSMLLSAGFAAILAVTACGPAPEPTAPGTPPVAPTVEQPGPGTGLEPKACTREAKLCPDGSAVSRTGPNCEFAPCPGEGAAPATP